MGTVGLHRMQDEHCEETLHHETGVPHSTKQSYIGGAFRWAWLNPHCTHDEHCEEMLPHATGVPRSTTQSCIAMTLV